MLKVSNLSSGYGDAQVLFDVSLEVEQGRIVSIVGANGAGKSTLINSISGILRPSSGDVLLEGVSLRTLAPHEVVRRGVVQVPEGRKLFARMTVYENLLLGAIHPRAKSERDESVKYVYRLFPVLEERKSQIAGTLSGGEQQMLAIGRALMCKPKLLMLDEPSLGLAPILVAEVFKVVRELNRSGLTVLLVEQNVRHCLSISDYAYVLENGQVVLQGSGSDLLANEHTRKAYLGL